MKTIAVRGGSLSYADQGAGEPALLFVHGFPLDHTMWRAQREAFAPVRRVLLPDLRGFGASPPGPEVMTMADYADDLAALVDAIGLREPLVLVGLSMGGYVAWQFAQRCGERLAGLVLCDTKAKGDDEEKRRARARTADRALAEGTGFLAETMLADLLSAETLAERPEIPRAVREQILRASNAGVAAAAHGMALRPDVSPWLARCPLPALVIVGAEDKISPPSEMRAIAKALPKARFVEVSGAGHLAPLEQPAAVNAAIGEFLDELE